MLKPYTYLLVDFCTIIVCFIASFDRRIRFDRHFASFLLSSAVVAIPFIAWDIWFTAKGVWWFDTNYTIGLILGGLPIEEWLFFFCIPFACLFTYYCLDLFFDWTWTQKFNRIIVFVTVFISLILAIKHHEKYYTLIANLALLVTILYLYFMAKVNWIGQASFTYLILMFGFFPVNGILTGSFIDSPIVNYNPHHFMGIRMFTIPVEDAIYGYGEFLLNLYFFKLFSKKLND